MSDCQTPGRQIENVLKSEEHKVSDYKSDLKQATQPLGRCRPVGKRSETSEPYVKKCFGGLLLICVPNQFGMKFDICYS